MQRTQRGRFGEPEELAGAAVYLASRASVHMTGAELIIDGGSRFVSRCYGTEFEHGDYLSGGGDRP